MNLFPTSVENIHCLFSVNRDLLHGLLSQTQLKSLTIQTQMPAGSGSTLNPSFTSLSFLSPSTGLQQCSAPEDNRARSSPGMLSHLGRDGECTQLSPHHPSDVRLRAPEKARKGQPGPQSFHRSQSPSHTRSAMLTRKSQRRKCHTGGVS